MLVLFAHSSLNVDFQNPLRPQFLFKIGIIVQRILRINIQERTVQKYKVEQNHLYQQLHK